jgi:hypothetical protein
MIGRELMHPAEIRVRCYDGARECDVIVLFRGKETTIRCRDYDQAVKWARIECKSIRLQMGSSWSVDFGETPTIVRVAPIFKLMMKPPASGSRTMNNMDLI